MRVAVYPSDAAGCGYYRLRWAAESLQLAGADVVVLDSIPAIWQRTAEGPKIVGAATYDADVAVFQRVFRKDLLVVMRSLRDQGVAIVIDIDDDLSALSPRHPVYRHLHPVMSPEKNWAVLSEAVKLADMVTVSTPALAQRYGGRVIRNRVPLSYLSVQKEPDEDTTPVIGWTGLPATHPGDLEVVGDAVARVCEKGLARFRAIGDRGTLEVLGVPEQEHQQGLPLANGQYIQAVAQLDIGIVPLEDSAFNRAKSWLKGLEYASVGVPFVATPTGEYVELAGSMGTRPFANRPRRWHTQLSLLAESTDIRAAMSAQVRTIAAANTIEQHMVPEIMDAWASARVHADNARIKLGI